MFTAVRILEEAMKNTYTKSYEIPVSQMMPYPWPEELR
jgi:hypothetical protein